MRAPTLKQVKKYQKYLSNGERIVAVFGIGNRYFWSNFLSLLILSPLIIPIPFLLKLWHQKHTIVYLLTNRRVIIKRGFFSTEVTTAPYYHITHIVVKESFLAKLSFVMGDIIIHTAGPTPVEVHLLKIQRPLEIKNLIEELISYDRQENSQLSKKPLLPLQ
jgi:membrane protein YdbS with pleckstrin-like domain